MQRKTVRLVVLGTGLAVATVAACSDLHTDPRTPRIKEEERPSMTASFSCGLQYTQISTIYDSTLANYGQDTYTDTAQVCENWTGSDYQISIQTQGTSYGSAYPDTLTTVQYDGGHAAAYGNNGAQVADTSVGSTSFELANADSSQIQASYANPYYGVTSSGGDCVTDPTAITCSPNGNRTSANTPGLSMSVASAAPPGWIKRNEIRALLHGASEIARSASGNRQFVKQMNGAELTFEIDPETELLVGQHVKSASGETHAKMQWEKVRGRWVRSQLDADTYENLGGATNHTRATVRVLNLKLGGR